ncbi:MAG: Obg family GTPase CgtA, partial [Clostridia bacterium]|nr:Obg family GTPase CgtA [Clostridia bacterium]
QSGQKTQEHTVILELKTIADIGLVGFPNVGKSTLLGAITDAKPKIANYHFTTLSPNLGVLRQFDKTCVLADIPGLIEGASQGVGLGHQFLRHIERTRLIVHVIDISGFESRNPQDDFISINKELAEFSEVLVSLPQIIVLNKVDLLPEGSTAVEDFKKFLSTQKGFENSQIFAICASQRKGVENLVDAIFAKLETLPKPEPMQIEEFDFDVRDTQSIEVECLDEGLFAVSGGRMVELARKVNIDEPDSFAYFHRRLRDDGVIQKLRKLGLKDGDTVLVGDIEFEYTE